jgi:hypothetical protein
MVRQLSSPGIPLEKRCWKVPMGFLHYYMYSGRNISEPDREVQSRTKFSAPGHREVRYYSSLKIV